MKVEMAMDGAGRAERYPFTTLHGEANVLIFPNLDAGNIAYKLMATLGGADLVGPILVGMARPVSVLHRDADVGNVVHMAAITVVRAEGDVFQH